MAREDEVAAILEADVALMAILLGGVYTSGDLGPLGITRDTAEDAFGDDGFLQPCALVRQRGNVPTRDVVDYEAHVTSTAQVVEVYFYEDRGYTSIDAAMARTYTLLQGTLLADSFEVALVNVIDRQRDMGALNGASLARQDWAVYSIMGG